MRGGGDGDYLCRFVRPSSNSTRRASPDDAPTGPTLPHLRQRAVYPPSFGSTTMGATWPHR